MIVDIIYAFMFMGGGYALIKYRRDVKSWTGNFMWAEKYIGSGGTYAVIIMTGLFMIFLGVLYPFGGLEFITGDPAIGSSSIDQISQP